MRGERLLREFMGRFLQASHDCDQLPGGLADLASSDEFDTRQLEMGIEHEMEHTDDPDLAREIAMDHLIEDPLYYDHLQTLEAFDHSIPDDDAYKKKSVYVPDVDKDEINGWLDDMGMTSNRSKKRTRSK